MPILRWLRILSASGRRSRISFNPTLFPLTINKKHQKDFYRKEADAHGYRTRSAWKLRQLDDKYKLIKHKKRILELGAAPGGWTQVIRERAAQAKVIACDLAEMAPLPAVTILHGDFREQLSDTALQELLGDDEVWFDLMLSDMSPVISGNHLRDQAQMLELVSAAWQLAEKWLVPVAGEGGGESKHAGEGEGESKHAGEGEGESKHAGEGEGESKHAGAGMPAVGFFLVKVFHGAELDSFRQQIKDAGYTPKLVKPPASASKSREVYILVEKKKVLEN